MADEYIINLKANTKDAENSVDSFSEKVIGVGKTAAVALGGIFAASKLIDFFQASISEAMASEKAIRQFNGALQAAGVYTDEVSAKFQNYAQQLQNLTGVQDEAILDGARSLIEIGNLSGETLNRTIVSALDLAAARGIEASTAFEMLSRAAAGNVMAFQRMGVEFRKNATDAEKLNSVLAFIEQRFGGAAEAGADTFEKALKKLGNTWSDLLENFGKGVTESSFAVSAINMLSEGIKFLQFFINMNIAGIKNWIAVIQYVGSAWKAFVDGIGLLDFDRITNGIENAKNKMYEQMAANDAWLASTVSVTTASETALIPTFNRQAKAYDDAKISLESLRAAEDEYHNQLLDRMTPIQQMSHGFRMAMIDMSKSVIQLGRNVANTFVSGFSGAFSAMGQALVNGQDAFGAFGKAILQMLGNIAIQMGQFYIAAGIAALWLNPAQGAGMIAGGAALSILGGVLQALGGGGSSAPAPTGSAAMGGSATLAQTDTGSFINELTDERERNAPNTGVQVIVQGNILDRRETGLAIAEIINESFNTNGVTISATA